jgi:flagellar motility protein MotE (MotC chaperone)
MMNYRILPFLALLSFATVPFAIGVAEVKTEGKETPKTEEIREAPKKVKRPENCLVSDEVIEDIEKREAAIKEKEQKLLDQEKEIASQLKAVKDELAKLEERQKEVENNRVKDIAANAEKIKKLVDTLETMSPKSAAGVVGGIDEELAVIALSKISSVKTGKILSNLKNDQSARLSEMMAYGKLVSGKEKNRGESTERNPASK